MTSGENNFYFSS